MRCDTCDILLDAEDNYCRKCGAPVQLVQVPAVREVQPPALFRSTAAPLATGAAAVAATALLKWVLGQAVRSIVAEGRPRREPRTTHLPSAAGRRALARREPAVSAPQSNAREPKQVVEIFWYRRTVRD